MELSCCMCKTVIPYREVDGERFQPHQRTHIKNKKKSFVTCFNHELNEVDNFIKEALNETESIFKSIN